MKRVKRSFYSMVDFYKKKSSGISVCLAIDNTQRLLSYVYLNEQMNHLSIAI